MRTWALFLLVFSQWASTVTAQPTIQCANNQDLCIDDMQVIDTEFWLGWAEKAGRASFSQPTYEEKAKNIQSELKKDLAARNLNISNNCLACQSNAVACSLGQSACFGGCIASACSQDCKVCTETYCSMEKACGGVAGVSVQSPRSCPNGTLVKNPNVTVIANSQLATVCFGDEGTETEAGGEDGSSTGGEDESSPTPTPTPAGGEGASSPTPTPANNDPNCSDAEQSVVQALVPLMYGISLPGAYSCDNLATIFDESSAVHQGLKALDGAMMTDCDWNVNEQCLHHQKATGADPTPCANFTTLNDLCCQTCKNLGLGIVAGSSLTEREVAALKDFVVGLGYNESDVAGGNPCNWRMLVCSLDGTYDFMAPYAGGQLLTGQISPSIGKLGYMRALNLDNHHLSGELPEEIGGCTRLAELSLANNTLKGTLPASLGDLSRLQKFNLMWNNFEGEIPQTMSKCSAMRSFQVGHNRLSGQFPPMLATWNNLAQIDVSENDFQGNFPIAPAAISLTSLNAAGNSFTGIDGTFPVQVASVDGEPCRLKVLMGRNKMRSFPAALQNIPTVTHLDLSGNAIQGLPKWGVSFAAAAFSQNLLGDLSVGDIVPCDINIREAPKWFSLISVDLSMNPLSIQFEHFLRLFNKAPFLIDLLCKHCNLSGQAPPDMYARFLYSLDVDETGTSFEQCRYDEAFTTIQRMDFSENPELPYEVISVDESQIQRVQLMKSCPTFSYVTEGKKQETPFLSQASCQCIPTMMVYEFGKERCGCENGYWMNRATGECEECHNGLSCDWEGNSSKSVLPPPLSPGYWAECVKNDTKGFSISGLYACRDGDTCKGGPIHGDGCSETVHCAANRGGMVCGMCKPGFYGTSAGDCSECSLTAEESLTTLLVSCFVLIPVLHLLIVIFAKSSGTMSKFKTLRQVKIMGRQLLKHSQLLGVIANLRVHWPGTVLSVLKFCQLLSTQLEQLFQLGCLTNGQTATESLLIKWLGPLFILVLCLFAILYSICLGCIMQLVPRCKSCAQTIRLDFNTFVVFTYMIWSVYFATLTSNSLIIFTCIEHPNGDYRVSSYPEVTCGSGEYWGLAVGGFVCLVVYVLMWFWGSSRAVTVVQETLISSGLQSRGLLEFATDGLRMSRLRYNIYAAAKDVSIAVVVSAFSISVAFQLIISAAFLIVWALTVLQNKPYDTWACNCMEIWASMGLAMMLVLSAGLGFGDDNGADVYTISQDGEKAVLMTIVLIGGLGVPILLLIFDLLMNIPFCRRCAPKSFVKQPVEQEVEAFQAIVPQEDWFAMMRLMDDTEWTQLLACIGETRSRFQVKKTEKGDSVVVFEDDTYGLDSEVLEPMDRVQSLTKSQDTDGYRLSQSMKVTKVGSLRARTQIAKLKASKSQESLEEDHDKDRVSIMSTVMRGSVRNSRANGNSIMSTIIRGSRNSANGNGNGEKRPTIVSVVSDTSETTI